MPLDMVRLTNTEGIERAAREITAAADTVRRLVCHLDEALHQHRLFLDEWITRFEAALAGAGNTGKQG